ncbi:hypothetical protein RQP46_005817 [Phenoliferia psychrophenolica]
MCLGLEMLRGGDIRLLDKDVRVSHRGDEAGDGVVLVETPTDVRVYVDERCPETVSWFERTFCAKGREGRGIKLDVAGEQVIIFASYPDLSGAKGATTVTPLQRPPLTLFLGRAAPLKTRKPRPDDPMPREETFFAARLRESNFRRTTSLPVLSFDLPSSKSKHPPKPPLVRTTSRPSKKAKEKERHVQGLLSGKDPPKATTTDKGKARATLKKILLGRLVDRGVGREHDDFRDVFSLSLKGVQYALRMTFQTTLLDRPRATQLVDRHLDMYITSPALVKIEEGEGEGAHHGRTGTGGILPSPESLEASGA